MPSDSLVPIPRSSDSPRRAARARVKGRPPSSRTHGPALDAPDASSWLLLGGGLLAPLMVVVLAHVNVHLLAGAPFRWTHLLLPLLGGLGASALLLGLRHARRARADALRNSEELQSSILEAEALHEALEFRIAAARTHELGQLVAVGAVHDLRNALTTVQMVGELLMENPPDLNELGAQLIQTADQSVPLCERVLKAYSGQDFRPVRVDMTTWFETIATDLKYIVGTQGELQKVIGTGTALVDPSDLHQILTNVVDNSRRASKSRALIQFKCRQIGDSYLIRVRDRGPGFPPPVLAGNFTPGSSTHGFGLQIVEALVQRNHGRLSLANYEDGAEVKIELRKAPASAGSSGRRSLAPPDRPASQSL